MLVVILVVLFVKQITQFFDGYLGVFIAYCCVCLIPPFLYGNTLFSFGDISQFLAGVISCNQHLCPFLALTQRCSPQKRGIATLGKLHQLADKNFLLGCRWYVMEYLILLRTVNTYVLGCTKIANLRIKVIEANVIG